MKYNKSQIMKSAWEVYRMSSKWAGQKLDFAKCLRRAWASAKRDVQKAAEAARTGRRRMHYAEYKRNYAECRTVTGSYDKRTKTIEVLVNVHTTGICPLCGTYCHGDCIAC